MTADPLPPSAQPFAWRWSLWTRELARPDHWERQAVHRRDRCWDLAAAVLADHPDWEALVLPPGERPCLEAAT